MPSRRRPEASAYRKAQVASRTRAAALSRQSVSLVIRDLRLYADEITAQLRRLRIRVPPTPAGQLQAIEQSRKIVRAAADKLERRLLSGVGDLRELAFTDLQMIWMEAAERAAIAGGIDLSVLGAVRMPPLTLMGAYESLGAGKTWRTLLPELISRQVDEAQAVIRAGIIQGYSPDVLARQLRPYVMGSKDFMAAARGLPDVNIHDLRSLVRQALHDPRARSALNASRVMKNNAQRIAFSEVYNARAEAEIQHYAVDPMVKMIQLKLAPYRGKWGRPDECDGMALNDFFGLGIGMYPFDQPPLPQHPWCRCERVPIIRPWAEIGNLKPMPNRIRTGNQARLPKGIARPEAERIRDRVETNLMRAESINPRDGLRSLAESSSLSIAIGI